MELVCILVRGKSRIIFHICSFYLKCFQNMFKLFCINQYNLFRSYHLVIKVVKGIIVIPKSIFNRTICGTGRWWRHCCRRCLCGR